MSTVAKPCVLIAADPARTSELAAAIAEPFERGPVEIVTTFGGDDTIDQFEAMRPEVVVITATLEVGDARSLIGTLRRMLPRAEVAIVVVGDDEGPVKTALDALELAPDKFVGRPLAAKALRFAVEACLDAVVLVRGLGGGAPDGEVDGDPTAATSGAGPRGRAEQRARWEALADSLGDEPDLTDPELIAVTPVGGADEAEPLPPVMIRPRRVTASEMEVVPTPSWRPGNTTTDLVDDWQAEPAREPTLILRDDPAGRHQQTSEPPPNVIIERGPDEPWSAPVPLSEVVEADSGRDVVAVSLTEVGNDLGSLEGELDASASGPMPLSPPSPPPAVVTPPPSDEDRPGGRDFARQLRAKMSQMAQRLFQHDTAAPAPVEVGPRHDAHTEIDLAALGEEPALVGTVTEIEMRPSARIEAREPTTSPGSWNTQVRERGLPDTGEIVRGISDAALLFAKMFSTGVTGRVAFRKDTPAIEKVVYFDQGRPVFGSSNEPGDRMGELLVREGKITAAQYERCQTHVAASGRRMGEILVDFGYLKRRELLPAVRRHVEDIVYSLFGWDRGHYHVHRDPEPCAERIRLSRHSASLILEGVRRKLDRSALEKLVGSAATVIELADRERARRACSTSAICPARSARPWARSMARPTSRRSLARSGSISPTCCRSRGGCACSVWRSRGAPSSRLLTNRPRSSARPISRSIANACGRGGRSSARRTILRCSAYAAMRPGSRSVARTKRRVATSRPIVSRTTCAVSSRRSSTRSRRCSTRRSACCATIGCG